MPLYIGLMSGTSMDSVDAALVEIDDHKTELRLFHEQTIAESLKAKLKSINEQTSIGEMLLMDKAVADVFATATQQLLKLSDTPASAIRAIGSHGQTILHTEINGHLQSLQIGDANQIAQQTGITTIADFRRMDIAHGGQGAPLAPAFHAYQFASARPCVILNIGGFSNITLIPKDPADAVIGFDCGPGNILMDEWVRLNQQQNFDTDGAWAATGKTDQALLQTLLKHPFFDKKPPKSTGRDDFNINWLKSKLDNSLQPKDVQATLLAFTVSTISHAIESYCPANIDVFVCGGGTYNQSLMQSLQAELTKNNIRKIDDIGIPANAVEAVCFAWLAHQRLAHQPGNLPAVTGAHTSCVLGAVYES